MIKFNKIVALEVIFLIEDVITARWILYGFPRSFRIQYYVKNKEDRDHMIETVGRHIRIDLLVTILQEQMIWIRVFV